MNFNRVLILIPLVAAFGCANGEYASEAAMPTDSTTGSARTMGSEPEIKLASTTPNPVMKTAAVKRAVIRNGELTVRVPSVEDAEKKVNSYVNKSGGFIATSESSDLTASAPTISLKLRIPASTFDTSILYFEGLGSRLHKKVSGEDVTAQLVDFDARLKIMQAQEDSFRGMLAKATNTTAMADLQTRIMELRAEIEGLSAQRTTMRDLASLSTIDLTLVGESKGLGSTEDRGWVQETWNASTATLGGIFKILGVFVIFAVVLSPLWGPVAWLIVRATRRPPVHR